MHEVENKAVKLRTNLKARKHKVAKAAAMIGYRPLACVEHGL